MKLIRLCFVAKEPQTACCGARFLGLFLLAMAMAGCASTRMTSQANPETAGQSFDRIIAYGNFQSLEYRKLSEQKLCTELMDVAGCECLKSSDVFFVGQDYTASQIANRLIALEIDAVLTLQATGSGTSSTYIPQTSHTTGSATVTGNTVWGSSTTQSYGGYDIEKPWANYEAILWSVSDQKVAWYATAVSSGNAYAGWDDLIHSASSTTVDRLVSDGVFPRLSGAE